MITLMSIQDAARTLGHVGGWFKGGLKVERFSILC